MHQILLLLPILAILLFFFLPLAWALPLFLITIILSLFAYGKAIRAQRQRVRSGRDEMLGERAVVDAVSPSLQVEYRGEIWSARSDVPVSAGESVRITGVDGLTLQVTPARSQSDRDSS